MKPERGDFQGASSRVCCVGALDEAEFTDLVPVDSAACEYRRALLEDRGGAGPAGEEHQVGPGETRESPAGKGVGAGQDAEIVGADARGASGRGDGLVRQRLLQGQDRNGTIAPPHAAWTGWRVGIEQQRVEPTGFGRGGLPEERPLAVIHGSCDQAGGLHRLEEQADVAFGGGGTRTERNRSIRELTPGVADQDQSPS